MTDEQPPSKNSGTACRDGRLRMRAWLWKNSSATLGLRVTSCGRKRIAQHVSIRAGGGNAGLGGLSTCGSVWVCPSCSAKVAAQRADDLSGVIRAWQATGGHVALVTLTLSHGLEHKLSETWDAITAGWSAVRNGSGWKKDVRDFGIGGYCRVVEVTHSSRNGWHPHVHVLLFVSKDLDDAQCEALRSRLFGRWSTKLAAVTLSKWRGVPFALPKLGGYKTLEFGPDGSPLAVDVRMARGHDLDYVAGYVTKFGYVPRGAANGSDQGETGWSLSREVARGDLKRGRKGSRTPWEILEDAAEGHRKSRKQWYVWEAASRGRRQYAWAQGFRESLGLEQLESDEELAAREDERMRPVALLLPGAWDALVADLEKTRRRPGVSVLSRVLTAAAESGVEQLHAYLRELGVEFSVPGEAHDSDGYARVYDLEGPALSDRGVQLELHRAQAAREAHAVPAVSGGGWGSWVVSDGCRHCGRPLADVFREVGEHPDCAPAGPDAWVPYDLDPFYEGL